MVKMTPILLLLWIGFTVSAGANLTKRVVGGQVCNRNERRYHVKLTTISPDGFTDFCGGSLITDRWILSAAHCWTPGWTIYAVVGVHPGPGQRVEILSQPLIYRDNQNRFHDLMLLKLPYPTNIPHIDLPDCDRKPNQGESVNIAGHAATRACSNNERRPGQSVSLHCGDLGVVPCNVTLPHTVDNIFFFPFCGQSSTVDLCLGDSGGGVVYKNKIYGVINFTMNGTHALVAPAGFVDICHHEYIDWIRNNIATHAP